MIPLKPLAVLLVLALPTTLPDEGEWLPIQVRNMDWKKLAARGMKLTKDEFWHPTKGGVLSAAVQIGGCTASFISDEGLVITNHHCGFGAINRLSTVETNYLRDGFVSADKDAELPTNMTVSVVRRIEDVSAQVKAAQDRAKSPIERVRITNSVMKQIARKGEINAETGQPDPNTRCMVASFFEGREYHLYYRTVITDVRLVYAPPRSVGEYGGEVDNWEWPRHTGDFSMFRAYVSPDGKPKKYHEDNVPFKPEHYLGVSRTGVHEKDLVLILGYPGRTERYLTSVAVADREAVYYPMRYALFTNIIERINAGCEGDEALELQFSSTVKSLANVQKNAEGMMAGLARNATVQLKSESEEAFTDWVDATAERRKKYGDVLGKLKTLDTAAAESSLRDLMFVTMMSSRTGPFFRQVIEMVRAASRQDSDKTNYPPRLMSAARSARLTDNLHSIQAPILAYLIDENRNLPEILGLPGAREFPTTEQDTLATLLEVLKASKLTSAKGRVEFLRGGKKSVTESKDPLVHLAAGMSKEWTAYLKRQEADKAARLMLGPRWIEAQQDWRGKSFYPDANSTLRVSIASIKGYQPRDGIYYPPHTTVAGILEKDTGEEPFKVPAALKKAAKNRKTSAFFDAKIGDVPVCFLSDGDTTGGNSGSPVING
ncbi:MAG: S46 family peptidase, partial [Planctomycetota bacterium]|nr:S46 family peptidase [Planctomycetota bacterium]